MTVNRSLSVEPMDNIDHLMTPTELLALAIAILAVVAILAPSSRAALTRREP